jgi:superfamily II DNA or RNA helicase
LAALDFCYSFRKYQQMILEVVESQIGSDNKYHIVAPPGSGKTIVGLELIRRFGRPAVVFAPTTTIQKQWQEKVGLFTEDSVWITQHTSLDASRLAEINCLTYHILSTPGENLEFVERVAIERWVDDLITSGKAESEEQARERIATLQEANPRAFRREVSKRYRRVKREFLQRGDFDGRRFLHPNARDLIDRIVALDTGTIVLDECHHLLDYWAFILRELIKALPDVRVIGLTATRPDPENKSEYENYNSLLGDVDFEVPTPAVVKEGNLAPYRDLVYFC